jgi:hypothetical protein
MAKKLLMLIVIIIIAAFFTFLNPTISGNIVGLITGQPVETADESEVDAVRLLLEDYASKHPILGSSDLQASAFSCLQLQDTLAAEGFMASITLGDMDAPDLPTPEEFIQFDHAWIMLRAGPTGWLAVEPNGYQLIERSSNELYYKGYVFNNPNDFQEYIRLLGEYKSEAEEIEFLDTELNDCQDGLSNMSIEYDKKYGGRFQLYKAADERVKIYEKLGECNTLSRMLEREKQAYSYTQQSIINLISASAGKLI